MGSTSVFIWRKPSSSWTYLCVRRSEVANIYILKYFVAYLRFVPWIGADPSKICIKDNIGHYGICVLAHGTDYTSIVTGGEASASNFYSNLWKIRYSLFAVCHLPCWMFPPTQTMPWI